MNCQYRAYEPTTDSHQALTDAWAEPVTVTIWGWAITKTEQPIEQNRRPTTTQVDIYAPPRTPNSPRGQWILDDRGPWEQIGEAEDFTHGPRPGGGLRIRAWRNNG